MLVLVVSLRWIYVFTLFQRDALSMGLISAECRGRDRREDVRKGSVGFIIPSCHCLVQESLGAVFQRRGGSAEPVHPRGAVGQCCAQGRATVLGQRGLSLPPLAQPQGKGLLWILTDRFPCLLSGIHPVSELLISLHSPALHPVPLSQMYLFKWL